MADTSGGGGAVDPVSAIAKAVGDIVGGVIKSMAARYSGIVNSNQSLQDYTAAQELQYADVYQSQLRSKMWVDLMLYAILGIILIIALIYILKK